MKEDWKVFIRGVEGRGDEVIKTLTDLGAKNYGQLDGEDAQDVYFISHNGIIGSTRFDSEVVDMLREYCHEVTLPERWPLKMTSDESNSSMVVSASISCGIRRLHCACGDKQLAL